MPAAAHLRRLRAALGRPTTVGELTADLGREGTGILIVFLSLPFLQPIPLAGLGTPVGLLLVALGARLVHGRETAALPRFVCARRLEGPAVERLLAASERLLRGFERVARPRGPALALSPRALGVAVILLGLMFAVPVFVPLGSPLCAASLALIGIGMAEGDGLLASAGLAGAGAALAYHAAFARLAWDGARALIARL